MGSRAQRKKGRFVGVPFHIVNSKEWDNLTAFETKLLIQLHRQYNGRNNGDFSCTYTSMKERGWNSPSTLYKAKTGLIEKGWIEETRKGYTGRCSLYAITWEAIDECNGKLDCKATKVPSMAFKKQEA